MRHSSSITSHRDAYPLIWPAHLTHRLFASLFVLFCAVVYFRIFTIFVFWISFTVSTSVRAATDAGYISLCQIFQIKKQTSGLVRNTSVWTKSTLKVRWNFLCCVPRWKCVYSAILRLPLFTQYPIDGCRLLRIRTTSCPFTRLRSANACICRCAKKLYMIFPLSERGVKRFTSPSLLLCFFLFSVLWHIFDSCTRLPGTCAAFRSSTIPTELTPRLR